MSAFDALTTRLPRTTLVVGKGGVGKTTCAAAIAANHATSGLRTLLLSTDPAAALGDVLGQRVGADPSTLDGWTALGVRQLDASALRTTFLERWRSVIVEIIDRGTYLDRDDIDGLVDAAFPGADETFALLALADILADDKSPYQRIVVDTAPTGHTLRLLALPNTARALVSMLDVMQEKHRFMVRALTHRYKRDAADAFIEDLRSRVEGLRAALIDHASLAAVVVTRAEPVVAVETERYVASLEQLGIGVAAIVVNAVSDEQAAKNTLAKLGERVPRIAVPRREAPPSGLAEIAELFRSSREMGVPRRASLQFVPQEHADLVFMVVKDDPRFLAERKQLLDLVRPLTIVGGKGGVGKSTMSCALAIAAADAHVGEVLLVSTDPAPSLADALGEANEQWATSDDEHALAGVPHLTVRQMNATAAFERLRDEYQERVDDLFASIVAKGVDIAHDRAVLRDLFSLAPPGIDELFALSLLGDTLESKRFARVIVDPAPTGHLIRLLEMPAIALDWTHRLMRLMLKYREVVGLGDTARDLLAFAGRTRALDALMRDRARCGLVLVALAEPVVRVETERLAAAAKSRGIDVSALLWNRVPHGCEDLFPLPRAVIARQFCADELEPPPIGVGALREWPATWRELA